VLAQFVGGSLGNRGASLPFKDERLRDDADGEGANLLGDLRNDRCCTGTGAAAHAGGHKDEVRAFKCGAEILNVFLRGALANG
jgi:hypothetical protein